jgi:opacity protein-like surface antigen
MKKVSIFLVILLLSIPSFSAQKFLVGISAGYYNVSDSDFKEIYSSGSGIYGFLAGMNIWKGLQVFGSYKFFSVDGKTTYTKEDLKFSMNPLTFALRYKYGKEGWKVKPYAGAGIDFYSYKEDVVNETEFMKDTSGNTTGYHIQLGGSLELIKNLCIDLNFKYTVADAKPYEKTVKLGGTEFGIGLLYTF